MGHRYAAIGLVMALPLANGTTGRIGAMQPHGGVRSFVVTAVQEMRLANGYPGVRGETAPLRVETTVWYAAPDRWRIERYYLVPPAEPALAGVFTPHPNVTVRNGPIAWTYDASSRTYAARSPLSSSVTPSAAPLPFEAAVLGEAFPSATPGRALSLPALLRGLAACDTAKEAPISRPTVVGQATMLGRPAYVIDFGNRPCGWTSASAGEVMGRRLLWVDQQTDFVLQVVRYSVYHPTQLFERATVTQLRYNVALPASRFVFTPPPGAHRAPAAPPPVALPAVKLLAVIRHQVSFPLVLPRWLPDGLRLQQTTVDGAQHVSIAYAAGDTHLSLLEGPLGCCLDADPRKYGGPTLPDGRPINLLDVGAQYGGLILWWDQGRTYIALSSSTLSKAALLRVAGGLSGGGPLRR
jgi:outer membrane lipoprotein-sorting protein